MQEIIQLFTKHYHKEHKKLGKLIVELGKNASNTLECKAEQIITADKKLDELKMMLNALEDLQEKKSPYQEVMGWLKEELAQLIKLQPTSSTSDMAIVKYRAVRSTKELMVRLYYRSLEILGEQVGEAEHEGLYWLVKRI